VSSAVYFVLSSILIVVDALGLRLGEDSSDFDAN